MLKSAGAAIVELPRVAARADCPLNLDEEIVKEIVRRGDGVPLTNSMKPFVVKTDIIGYVISISDTDVVVQLNADGRRMEENGELKNKVVTFFFNTRDNNHAYIIRKAVLRDLEDIPD